MRDGEIGRRRGPAIGSAAVVGMAVLHYHMCD